MSQVVQTALFIKAVDKDSTRSNDSWTAIPTNMPFCNVLVLEGAAEPTQYFSFANGSSQEASFPFVFPDFMARPIVIKYAAPSPGSVPTAPTSSATAAPSSEGGLSSGAKAGIGAGVGIAALIVMLAGIVFFMRVRQKGARPADPPVAFEKAEIHGKELGRHEVAKEVDPQHIHKMPDNGMPVETEGHEVARNPQELEAGQVVTSAT